MSIEDDIEFFERVPTLAVLGREALRILAIGAENRYVHNGDVLFRQGDSVEGAYVVQQGSFRLTAGDGDEAQGMTVGPGTMIGELSLLIETKSTMTATASQPSTVIRIPRTLFLKMLEGFPAAAARLRDQILLRTEETAREMGRVRGILGGSRDGQ